MAASPSAVSCIAMFPAMSTSAIADSKRLCDSLFRQKQRHPGFLQALQSGNISETS